MRVQVLPFLALALAGAVASAAAAPRLTVEVGFDGLLRPESPTQLRVELSNPGPDWSGRFRLEETRNERTSVAWEWRLDVPAGGRRVRFLTFTPAVFGQGGQAGLRAGLVGEGEPATLDVRQLGWGNSTFVVLTLTDDGTGFSAVRDALDPPGPNQGQVQVHLPALPPERVPPTPAAWESIDAILLDVDVAPRIDAPTWEAIRIRVAQGASLLIYGLGRVPDLIPAELVPGRPGPGAQALAWQEPATDAEHPALPLDLASGATRPAVGGQFLPWAASRRFAAGRVTVAALDLRELRSPAAAQVPLWAELLGLPPTGERGAIRPLDQAPALVVDEPTARSSLGVSALVLLLATTALTCGGALLAVRRSSDALALLRWAPVIGLGAALPLLVVGGVSRFLEDRRPLLIEEHVEALGLTRTTSVLTPSPSRRSLRRLPLDGWPVRLLQSASSGQRPLGVELHGGPAPEARGLSPDLTPGVSLSAERWEASAPPLRWERDAAGETWIRNASGRDLVDVHVLDGMKLVRVGDLADGATAALDLNGPAGAAGGSVAATILRPAAGRLQGPAIAGVVKDTGAGILGRPTAIVLAAWLEAAP